MTMSASVAAASSDSTRPTDDHSSSGTWTQKNATTAKAIDPSKLLLAPSYFVRP
jgi:hypothetical protein